RLGIAGPALMRAAGRALADAVVPLAAGRSGPVVVVCGGGNNGGDGYVAAELLRRRGLPVALRAVVDPGRLTGDAAWARDGWNGAITGWGDDALDGAAVVVDALLGTGARGVPREPVARAIAAINAAADAGAPILACDVPSG